LAGEIRGRWAPRQGLSAFFSEGGQSISCGVEDCQAAAVFIRCEMDLALSRVIHDPHFLRCDLASRASGAISAFSAFNLKT